MKKKKINLLFGVMAVCSLAFASNVKANGPIHEYPIYGNGNNIYYSESRYSECLSSDGYMCKEYKVSNDDGLEDEYITLTEVANETNVLNVSKVNISGGYVLHCDKLVDLYLGTEMGNGDPVLTEGANSITYFRINDDIISLVQNASMYDNIYLTKAELPQNQDLIIPSNITLTANHAYLNTITNNGTLKIAALAADKVLGTGTINLVYTDVTEKGNGPLDNTKVEEALRFQVGNISGVKVNILSENSINGLPFGYVGEKENFTETEAQKVIDMYNSVLGTSLNGYKLVLKSQSVEGAGEHYYGELVIQETINNTAAKTNNSTVKNPSTGDTIFIILAILSAAMVTFGVTLKKARQR